MSILGEPIRTFSATSKVTMPAYVADNKSENQYVFGASGGASGKAKEKKIDEGFIITKPASGNMFDGIVPDPSLEPYREQLGKQLAEFARQRAEEEEARRSGEPSSVDVSFVAGHPFSVRMTEQEMQIDNVMKLIKKNMKVCAKKSILEVLKLKIPFHYNGTVRMNINFVVYPGLINAQFIAKITEAVNVYLSQELALRNDEYHGQVLGCVKTDYTMGYLDIAIPFRCDFVQSLMDQCIEY